MIHLAQLTRSAEWWDHKTPQVLSLAYATALLGKVPVYHLLYPGFLMIFASLIALAIYASIINDYTDIEIDIACDKSNMMQRLHPAVRWLLILLSLGLVLLSTFLIYPATYAVVFYLLITLSISLYSFPPVRLKNRGIWGVLSCAAAEHLFPTLFSIAVVAWYSGLKLSAGWYCAAGILSFMYGVRSIIWHQMLDRENDLRSGIHTYGTMIEPSLFKNKARFLLILELAGLSGILIQLNVIIPIAFLLLYILFILLKSRFFSSQIIIVVSPRNVYFQIAMLDYYTVFFPISLLLYVAFTQPMGWLVLLIHLLLFYRTWLVALNEIYHLLRSLYSTLKK